MSSTSMTIETYLTYEGRVPMLELAKRAREELYMSDDAAEQAVAAAIAAALGAKRGADDYRQIRALADLLGPFFADIYLRVRDLDGPDSKAADAAWDELVAATDGYAQQYHCDALARQPAPPAPVPPFSATIEVPEACECSAAEVWLAAIEATSTVPLWAQLARAALDGGWPTGPGWDEEAAEEVISYAAVLANTAGAGAGFRVDRDQGRGGWLVYTTCAGTVVRRGPNRTVTIEGEGPSVLRRAVAAARAAGVPYEPEDGIVESAIVSAREHAARRAESVLLSSIGTVRPPDRW